MDVDVTATTEASRCNSEYGRAVKEGPDISHVAAAIGNPTRARMLLALLQIPAMTAGELASETGIAAQTASGHLQRLTEVGLLTVMSQGRHRYFRLADDEAAGLIEAMLGFSAHIGHLRTRPGPRDADMRRLRTCYDHLAGEIAVGLFSRLDALGAFVHRNGALDLTRVGHERLSAIGIDTSTLQIGREPTCRACLDWSERRHHLGGRAGAALLRHALNLQWLKRDGRRVELTRAGEAAFTGLFASP
jgi:DNA-binding transcriptional ArsR family regulator